MKTNKSQSIMKRLLAIVVAMLLVLSMAAMPAFAETSAPAADAASKGVFTIMVCSPATDDPHRYQYPISMGSGFLINENTVVTCYHVLHDDEFIAAMKERHGNNWKSKMEIRIYFSDDNFYKANEISTIANEKADFTALRVSQPLEGSRVLALKGNTEETVHRTDVVHALGFPSDLEYVEDRKSDSNTSKDVDIRTGNVNKLADLSGVSAINHSAALKNAMSGGPLVDAEGNVIGINVASMRDSEAHNYAVSVDPLIHVLDVTNTKYTAADGSTQAEETTTAAGGEETTAAEEATEPVAELDWTDFNVAYAQASSKSEDSFTPESFANLKAACTLADEVKAKGDSATQDEIDQAVAKINSAVSTLAEKPATNTKMILLIAAIALVVILAVVIIIVVARKGKNVEAEEMPVPPIPGGNSQWISSNHNKASDFTPMTSDDSETGVLSTGNIATTVLSSGSNETTVLNTKPYATLSRKSSGEVVQVNTSPFVIGKERRRVNFCIKDNATISRSHAQIIKNGTNISIIDMNSKNGTFVNSIKCDPNVSVALKNGDVITLSDEDFTLSIL